MLTPVYLTIPMVVAVIGALVYGISNNPKASEMGRLAYACGMLTALLALAHR
jgi:fructose-1-phosphate kinase PfkB-like protein